MLTEVRPVSDSEQKPEAKPIHLPLTWSGTSPPLTVSAVHPGSERHIDVLHVDLSARDAAPMQLDVNPKPTGGQDILEPGTYEISIELRARNADALRYVVPVSWDSKWSDRAVLWDHLRVEPLRRVP